MVGSMAGILGCITSVDAQIGMSRPLQGPEEVFAMAVLLGDLFPAEWPAPGRARTMGKPHPPPPGMGALRTTVIGLLLCSNATQLSLVSCQQDTRRLTNSNADRACRAKFSTVCGRAERSHNIHVQSSFSRYTGQKRLMLIATLTDVPHEHGLDSEGHCLAQRAAPALRAPSKRALRSSGASWPPPSAVKAACCARRSSGSVLGLEVNGRRREHALIVVTCPSTANTMCLYSISHLHSVHLSVISAQQRWRWSLSDCFVARVSTCWLTHEVLVDMCRTSSSLRHTPLQVSAAAWECSLPAPSWTSSTSAPRPATRYGS